MVIAQKVLFDVIFCASTKEITAFEVEFLMEIFIFEIVRRTWNFFFSTVQHCCLPWYNHIILGVLGQCYLIISMFKLLT